MNPKPDNKKIPVYIAAITAAIMVFAAGKDESLFIPAALTLLLVVVIAAITSAVARISKAKEAAKAKENEFPMPDAHCVVCENSGEDHFEHDRELRIRQLDDWLKSGLIDKAEYRELKRKYQSMH